MSASRFPALFTGLAVATLLVAAFAAGFFWLSPTPEPRYATLLPEPRALPEFTLVDEQGQPWTHESLTGNWDVLFFGFTHCPDICPASLGTLAATLRLLEERGKARPNAVFVSVDPARDDVARVAEYAGWFHPDMRGVTGALDAIDDFAGAAAIGVVRHDENEHGEYMVDHTTSLVLVDPQGRIAGYISAPLRAAEIAHDLEILMSQRKR